MAFVDSLGWKRVENAAAAAAAEDLAATASNSVGEGRWNFASGEETAAAAAALIDCAVKDTRPQELE